MINATALRVIRERSGLSQLELAARSGVSQGRISDIEAGSVNVRPSTVRKLADALLVPVVALMDSEGVA